MTSAAVAAVAEEAAPAPAAPAPAGEHAAAAAVVPAAADEHAAPAAELATPVAPAAWPAAAPATAPAAAPIGEQPAQPAQPAPGAPTTKATDDSAAIAPAATQQAPVDQTPAAAGPPPPAAPAASAAAPAHAPTLPVRADHVRAMLRVLQHRGQVQAQLSLHPAELGGVEVRLRQTAHGLMATVTADRAEAAQVLQQAGTELRRALEAQGVRVAALDIGMAGDNQDAANARANERRAESALSGARRAGAGSDDNEPSPIDPDHHSTTTAPTIALGALVDVLA
jgi:Meckel syndrome type 1 protein